MLHRERDMTIHAHDAFHSFLTRHHARVGAISPASVTLNDLIDDISPELKPTNFNAYHDTMMYAEMIERIVSSLVPDREWTLIDLGAGSSIPTLRALSRLSNHCLVRVIAVDLDREALATSQANVAAVGMDARYTHVNEDIAQFVTRWNIERNQIVVTNPPYMPVPEDARDPMFVPVDGGPDGARYVRAILTMPMPPDTLVGIRWCSLTNPLQIIDIIEKAYDVVDIDARRASFGVYAHATRDYLETLRSRELAVFEDDQEGGPCFTFMSTILRRK